MEALGRSESSGTAAAALELVLMSAIESMVVETILDAGKSLFWLLCLAVSEHGLEWIRDEMLLLAAASAQYRPCVPLSSLWEKQKDEPIPRTRMMASLMTKKMKMRMTKVASKMKMEVRRRLLGDEGNEEDEDEDELEANGGGGSDDDEEDDDDDDEDDEDGEDEDEEGDEEDDEDQPPPKKRK
ncbi:hypothetical protein HPP92_010000 [Vanilla planifolia]|uniref:Uncharacterized protein n=1 Tax=Vanilla planifolia TaxID=51239 RepID=A0A835V7I4_VANPL|nr:hypothetical protein HPP92_010000 [Vanilla planifolia]